MASKFEQDVKAYMTKVIADHVDPRTNETDATGLGEAAIAEFDLRKDNGQPKNPALAGPDGAVWDWAVEVAESYEATHG